MGLMRLRLARPGALFGVAGVVIAGSNDSRMIYRRLRSCRRHHGWTPGVDPARQVQIYRHCRGKRKAKRQ